MRNGCSCILKFPQTLGVRLLGILSMRSFHKDLESMSVVAMESLVREGTTLTTATIGTKWVPDDGEELRRSPGNWKYELATWLQAATGLPVTVETHPG